MRPFQGRFDCLRATSGVTAGAITFVAFSDFLAYVNRSLESNFHNQENVFSRYKQPQDLLLKSRFLFYVSC
jgi:hypothetical protein